MRAYVPAFSVDSGKPLRDRSRRRTPMVTRERSLRILAFLRYQRENRIFQLLRVRHRPDRMLPRCVSSSPTGSPAARRFAPPSRSAPADIHWLRVSGELPWCNPSSCSGDPGNPVRCVQNLLDIAAHRVFRLQRLQQFLAIPADDHQRIVQVVRQAARQPVQRVETLARSAVGLPVVCGALMSVSTPRIVESKHPVPVTPDRFAAPQIAAPDAESGAKSALASYGPPDRVPVGARFIERHGRRAILGMNPFDEKLWRRRASATPDNPSSCPPPRRSTEVKPARSIGLPENSRNIREPRVGGATGTAGAGASRHRSRPSHSLSSTISSVSSSLSSSQLRMGTIVKRQRTFAEVDEEISLRGVPMHAHRGFFQPVPAMAGSVRWSCAADPPCGPRTSAETPGWRKQWSGRRKDTTSATGSDATISW